MESGSRAGDIDIPKVSYLTRWFRRLCLGKRGLPVPCSTYMLGGEFSYNLVDDILSTTMVKLDKILKLQKYWTRKLNGTKFDNAVIWTMRNEVGPELMSDHTYNQHHLLYGGNPTKPYDTRQFATFIELIRLKQHLALFLSKVYTKVQSFGLGDYQLHTLLCNINTAFQVLEEEVNGVHADSIGTLSFKKAGDVNDGSLSVNTICDNLSTLDEYLSSAIYQSRNPNTTKIRIGYILGGAVGISLISFWIFRMNNGSETGNDLLLKIGSSFRCIFQYLVQKPLELVRETLSVSNLNKYEKRMSLEVEEASAYLHTLLVERVEEESKRKCDSDMLKILFERFCANLNDPFPGIMRKGFFDPVRVLLQSGKLFYNESKLKMIQLASSNRNLLIFLVAIVPTTLIATTSAAVGSISYTFATKIFKTRRNKRRFVLLELKKIIMQFNACVKTNGRLAKDSRFLHGLMLFTLDHAFKVIKRSAKKTNEWHWVMEALIQIGESDVENVDHGIHIRTCAIERLFEMGCSKP